MDGQRPAPAQLSVDHRVTDLRRGDVQGAELSLELLGVVNHGGQVAQGDELAVVQQAANEAGVAVSALLAVGEDVNASANLGVDGEPRRIVRRGVKLHLLEPALQVVVHGLEHPAGPRPAADAHDGQRRDPGRGSRRRERSRDRNLDPELLAYGSRRDGASPLHEGPLADEKAALPPAPRPRDQLVAGQAAPGRQLDLDRRVRGQYLQQPSALQGVDVASNQEQQPSTAVQVAAVEADVGLVRVPSDGIHQGICRRMMRAGGPLNTLCRGCRRRGTPRARRRLPSWRRQRGCLRRGRAS